MLLTLRCRRRTPATPGTSWLAPALAALVLAVSAFGPQRARAAEAIEHFDSQVEVAADGTLTVTETLRVRAEGREIKRGIYRDFPLEFRDDRNRLRRVSFDLIDVTRDGRPEPHFTRSSNAGVRIYAGQEKVLLRPGTYTYRISYRTSRQIRFLPDHDELFWNVTGNEWAFPILSATATFRLPGNAAPIRWTAFTGTFGERGDAWRGEVLPDGVLQVGTTQPLAPRAGLSVVAEIPRGLVAEPSGAARLRYAVQDYRRFVFGGIGALAVLAFYLIAWRAVGRDPPKGTIIPLFHPPEGISPALAGYVRDWGWSGAWRDFTAATVSLAVKGQLVFDDAGGDLTLARRGATAAKGVITLPPGEQAILSWVDAHGGTAKIDKNNGASLANVFSTFKSAIERENRNRFFRRNLGYFLFGVALTAITLVTTLAFGNLSDPEIAVLVIAGFVCAIFGLMLMPLLRVLMGRRKLRTIIAAGINLAVIIFIGTMAFTLFAKSGVRMPEGFARQRVP